MKTPETTAFMLSSFRTGFKISNNTVYRGMGPGRRGALRAGFLNFLTDRAASHYLIDLKLLNFLIDRAASHNLIALKLLNFLIDRAASHCFIDLKLLNFLIDRAASHYLIDLKPLNFLTDRVAQLDRARVS